MTDHLGTSVLLVATLLMFLVSRRWVPERFAFAIRTTSLVFLLAAVVILIVEIFS